MATALYRRYRPETFSEMIGQAQVTEPLMTALRTGRVGHAYLFSGPRGCGKTTSARILARCLNCAEGPTDSPCGQCESCVELSRDGGGSLDVVEIDAASHGGVEDARELRERAVFAPARDRFKIFIIDEAHMVTSGGFNALLKIVEEPPPHVKFVFATTEPEKVIGTIRSRTHHYPFRLIAPGTLIDYVQHLCESEGIEVEQGVLPLVARAGGGSVRDSLSILDQLIAGSEGSTVTLERANGLLGFTSSELLDEVVTALGIGDSAAAFEATDRVVQTGQDPRRFVEDLLERLRDLIVVSATTVEGATAVFRGVPIDQLERMFAQAQGFPRGLLSRLADTVGEALDRMTGATAPRLHLELMVARALVVTQEAAGPGAAPAVSSPSSMSSPRAEAESPAAARRSPAAPVPAAGPAAPASGEQRAPSQPAGASAAPPAAQSARSTAEPTASPVDVIATMRSARDFLQSGSAASEPPSSAPAPPRAEGEAQALSDPPAAPNPAPAAPTPAESPAVEASVDQPSFAELLGLWPDLLQDLLESDREAWNAVKNVQPIALDGVVLSVGLESQSDFQLFRTVGSGPLRETIEAALGVTVKFLRKPLPGTSAKAAQAAGQTDENRAPVADATPSRSAPAEPSEPPAPAEPSEPPAPAEPSEPPAPAWSTGGEAESSTGGAGNPAAGSATGASLDVAGDAPAGASPDLAGDAPAGGATRGAAVPSLDDETEQSSAAASTVEPEPPAADEPAAAALPAPPQTPAPIEGRYGEAVVREVLSARFVEERPLPESEV